MTKKGGVAALAVLLTAASTSFAAIGAGQKEIMFSFDWTQFDTGANEPSQFNADIGLGYFLTEMHEVIVNLAYSQFDPDITGVGSTDSGSIGGGYRFNWPMGDAMWEPYVGGEAHFNFGDGGDLFDFGYSVSGGSRFFVTQGWAFFAELFWGQENADQAFDDLDAFGVRGGISAFM